MRTWRVAWCSLLLTKRNRNWEDREKKGLDLSDVLLPCLGFSLSACRPVDGKKVLMCGVNLTQMSGNGAMQPPVYFKMFLAFFLRYHLGILLQNMDILNYNLLLLSYWSWLCLRFGSFPNTITVFTCSSQGGNCMWKHSIRRWYFVAIIHKPCVYMGFLRRIQSISPFCDASTSISNDCSKSLYFLQK